MRKKVGVSVVKKKQSEDEQYNKVGRSLEETKLSFVQDVLTSFKISLAEFAGKHKQRINSDPEFRQQFHAMCVSVGVDPLASCKGFWADILGVGDFYFELGVKIIDITVRTRSTNGGIISIKEVFDKINKVTAKTNQLHIQDIIRAVEKLAVLGNGFKIINNSENPLIISVPLELNNDHEYLLSVASDDEDGCITEEHLKGLYGWTSERFHIIIKPLLQEGIIWIDIYQGKIIYDFVKYGNL